jgi:DNA-binding beta-propeller fold protein YncE
VLVIDVASGKVTSALETGKDPIAVHIAPDQGSAIICNASDDHLSRVQLRTLAVQPLGRVNMPNGLTVAH